MVKCCDDRLRPPPIADIGIQQHDARMRGAFNIGLAIWLALSLLWWMIVLGFPREDGLPSPRELPAFLLLYAPWLLLLLVAAKGWRDREGDR